MLFKFEELEERHVQNLHDPDGDVQWYETDLEPLLSNETFTTSIYREVVDALRDRFGMDEELQPGVPLRWVFSDDTYDDNKQLAMLFHAANELMMGDAEPLVDYLNAYRELYYVFTEPAETERFKKAIENEEAFAEYLV